MNDRTLVESPKSRWIDVTPSTWSVPSARRIIRTMVSNLGRLRGHVPAPVDVEIVKAKTLTAARKIRSKRRLELALSIHVFCDLRSQGWQLRCSRTRVSALVPVNGFDATTEKARVRAAHELDRDDQLRQPAVRRFIRDMEQLRLYKREWRSVFSIMRDGADLANRLAAVASTEGAGAEALLSRTIDPYVQPAIAGKRCRFTGLDLFDVWRYFRHSWTTAYQSTPGRKLFFLIRDRAADCHPVIGIAALGSPIVQLTVRDEWIGWTTDAVLKRMAAEDPETWRHWIDTSLKALLGGIYTADFIKEGHLRRTEITRPTTEALDRLMDLASKERAEHRLYPQREQHKRLASSRKEWTSKARTHLFRSKRASALAELLRARLSLRRAGLWAATAADWGQVLALGPVRQALAIIIRQVKASHVGVDVMDITVCGAVAPYNHVLGGKLVALMMASPLVRREYQRRYKRAASIIASSMAGRPIIRRPRLVLLGTTSLYSVAPSQYNRLRMRLTTHTESLAYEPLGQTVGYGSYHFSQETIATLELLLSRNQSGRQVNSIFGEGVNPKLRKVRAALDAIGLPSNLLLQHGSPRLVYAVVLARNFRDVLLGVTTRPDYFLPFGTNGDQQIVDHWRSRWLSGRVRNPDVLRAVAHHVLVSPVRHGARVVLPQEGAGAAYSHESSTDIHGREEDWTSGVSDEAETDRPAAFVAV